MIKLSSNLTCKQSGANLATQDDIFIYLPINKSTSHACKVSKPFFVLTCTMKPSMDNLKTEREKSSVYSLNGGCALLGLTTLVVPMVHSSLALLACPSAPFVQTSNLHLGYVVHSYYFHLAHSFHHGWENNSSCLPCNLFAQEIHDPSNLLV